MTQGIFQKIFALFQEACHELDLKLAMHWRENPINSSEYEGYCSMLRDLSTATICNGLSLVQNEVTIEFCTSSCVKNACILEYLLNLSPNSRCWPCQVSTGSLRRRMVVTFFLVSVVVVTVIAI